MILFSRFEEQQISPSLILQVDKQFQPPPMGTFDGASEWEPKGCKTGPSFVH